VRFSQHMNWEYQLKEYSFNGGREESAWTLALPRPRPQFGGGDWSWSGSAFYATKEKRWYPVVGTRLGGVEDLFSQPWLDLDVSLLASYNSETEKLFAGVSATIDIALNPLRTLLFTIGAAFKWEPGGKEWDAGPLVGLRVKF